MIPKQKVFMAKKEISIESCKNKNLFVFQHLEIIQIFTIHFYILVLQSKEQKVSPITTFSKKMIF